MSELPREGRYRQIFEESISLVWHLLDNKVFEGLPAELDKFRTDMKGLLYSLAYSADEQTLRARIESITSVPSPCRVYPWVRFVWVENEPFPHVMIGFNTTMGVVWRRVTKLSFIPPDGAIRVIRDGRTGLALWAFGHTSDYLAGTAAKLLVVDEANRDGILLGLIQEDRNRGKSEVQPDFHLPEGWEEMSILNPTQKERDILSNSGSKKKSVKKRVFTMVGNSEFKTHPSINGIPDGIEEAWTTAAVLHGGCQWDTRAAYAALSDTNVAVLFYDPTKKVYVAWEFRKNLRKWKVFVHREGPYESIAEFMMSETEVTLVSPRFTE